MTSRTKDKIDVIAYSGYRAEETPRTILLRGVRIEVIEILSQWIEERSDNRDRKRFYQIKGKNAALHVIYYDEKQMEWFHLTNV